MHYTELTQQFCAEQVVKHRTLTQAARALIKDGGIIGQKGHPLSLKQVTVLMRDALPDHQRVTSLSDDSPVVLVQRLLEEAGFDPSELKSASRIEIRGGVHTGFIKNKDGEIELTPELKNAKTKIVLHPKWAEGPAWPPVQPAKPASIKYTSQAKMIPGQPRRTLVIGDLQIGYWRVSDGVYEPFHDESAINVTMEIISQYRPSEIVLIGDCLDLPEHSKYVQEEAFQQTTQMALQRMYDLLCYMKSAVGPQGKIVWIEGNHERRMREYVLRNARAAFGLRPADAAPESWPVNSIPYLLHLDKLNVKYVAGYPSSQHWIVKDKLVAQHQDPHKTDIRASIIHGHREELKLSSRTIHYQDGTEVFYTWSIPGLTRVEDLAPSPDRLCHSAVPSDRTRRNVQQAIAAVDISPDESFFSVTPIAIHKGRAMFRGREYVGL